MAIRISVVTPTFNRANVLDRVFDSLEKQTIKDFEWIIIDDGSKDNTKEVVDSFVAKATFPIQYYYQENNGKHIAVNKGVELAQGEFIAIADSDDSFTADAFEIMLKYWDMLSDTEKKEFRGITCRCFDPETNEKIGRDFEKPYVDCSGLDATYKNGFNFEMWGINRTDIMRMYPFPDIRRSDKGGLRFFPETIIWNTIDRDYKTRFINECLRGYYRDQENATTHKKADRSRENVYLWEHLINNVFDYAKYRPKRFVKAFIGISRDNLLIGNSFLEIVKKGNTITKRILIALFFPVGWMLYRKSK